MARSLSASQKINLKLTGDNTMNTRQTRIEELLQQDREVYPAIKRLLKDTPMR